MSPVDGDVRLATPEPPSEALAWIETIAAHEGAGGRARDRMSGGVASTVTCAVSLASSAGPA